MLVVEKLTKEIIEEAVQELVNKKDEAYWLKLYHVANRFEITELNAVIKRIKESSS